MEEGSTGSSNKLVVEGKGEQRLWQLAQESLRTTKLNGDEEEKQVEKRGVVVDE